MKTILTSTITGPDQPETLGTLAQHTREAGGEWLIAKIIKLDGLFTAIVRITIDQPEESGFRKQLQDAFPSLVFSYHKASDIKPLQDGIVFELDCLDRPGLTRDINDFLDSLDIQVGNMESTRHPLGSVTSTLYSTRVTLALPKGTDKQTVIEKLTTLSPDIKIESP